MVPGGDVAGTVVQLGEGCSRLKVGDRVWGNRFAIGGGMAEYAIGAEEQPVDDAHQSTHLNVLEGTDGGAPAISPCGLVVRRCYSSRVPRISILPWWAPAWVLYLYADI